MKQNKFLKLCQHSADREDHLLTEKILGIIRQREVEKKLPVVWLETSDSGDNNISFMNATYPYLNQVFFEMIDLLYSNTFMAAQGQEVFFILRDVAERLAGQFTLVVEGAVPVKEDGLFNVVVTTETDRITALEAVNWLGGLAKYIVAAGTCASFGGASAARPNLTGSLPVNKVLERDDVINVSGCPINPDWFVGTLAHLLMYGMPELDSMNRPLLFYGFTIHRHCQRRSYFDKGNFAEKIGDIKCMFSQGCVGPRTGADCPYRQWINVNWPVEANTPCIGCTNRDFPDGSTPFFIPLPDKKKWAVGNEDELKKGDRER